MPSSDGVARRMLVVPGTEVAIHWIDLAEGLTEAQAAAAARLILADAAAEPLSEMHVAVGRPEEGLTPVALVSARRMEEWVAADPDIILPSPFLIPAPEQGLVRRDALAVADYRGRAAAFSAEPELAAMLVGAEPVAVADEVAVEAGLVEALERPPINLRQGPFARRRQWKLEAPRMRRMALLAVGLALLSLAEQVATILSYTFAADQLEADAEALGGAAQSNAAEGGPGFGAAAAVLFESVRVTPNVELARIDYRADGRLVATVMMDGPATLAALQSRIEAGGLRVEPGEQRTAGGRPTADLTVRPG